MFFLLLIAFISGSTPVQGKPQRKVQQFVALFFAAFSLWEERSQQIFAEFTECRTIHCCMVGDKFTVSFLFFNILFFPLDTQLLYMEGIKRNPNKSIEIVNTLLSAGQKPIVAKSDGTPPQAVIKLLTAYGNKYKKKALIIFIRQLLHLFEMAASFLCSSYGHPQAQTVPSTAWAAPCPVVTPSLPGLARRFLQEQYTMPC